MLKAQYVNVTGNQDAMLALLAQTDKFRGSRRRRPTSAR